MTENRSGGAVGPGAEPRPPSEPQSQPEMQPRPGQRPPTLDEVLAAAARPEPVAPRGAEDAVAAFRAARDEGALGLPTRSADDWRPAERRKRAPWIRTGLGTFAAGVLLGGVAMASGAIPAPFGTPSVERPGPATGTSTPSGDPDRTATPPQATTGSAGLPATTPDAVRPTTAEDRAAHCRAYEAAQATEAASAAKGVGKGRALDSAVRERLEAAAGGPDAVEAYCARLLDEGPPDPGAAEQRPTSTPDRNNTAAAVPPGAGAARDGQGEGHAPARRPARQ
ncbi:hypothetical protein ACWGI0_21465 [Streptomyces sp. NPDC054802]